MPPNVTEATVEEKDGVSSIRTLLRDPGVLRLMRWWCIGGLGLLSAATYLLLWLRATAPLSDPDTWWHLEMGERFLDGTSIRHPGPLSEFGTEDWRPRDWLTQMVAAAFEDAFGLPGVAWLFGLGMVALAVLLYRVSRARASVAAAVVATPIGLMACMTGLTARPQLVSFALLAVTVGAVLRTADDLRPRWWLALMTGVWACVHGMWFLSIALQVLLLVGLLLDRRLDRSSSLRLVGVMLLSVAAVAVTPNGLHLLSHPLGTSLGIAEYIQEYQPPTVANLYYVAALFMLAATVLVWARGSRPTYVQMLLLVAAAGFTVQMQRTIPIGAVIATPLFAMALDGWLSRLQLLVPRALERTLVYGGALSAVAGLAFTAAVTADRPSDRLPVAFENQLEAIAPTAVLFNELSDGGYLRWRHPELRIVEDGLSDQYSTGYHLEYFAAVRLEEGWQDFLRRVDASHALLTRDHPLRQALELSGWQVIAADDTKVLMEAPSSQG